MGNNSSSVAHSSVRSKIEEVAAAVLELGDSTAASRLFAIADSPNFLNYCRTNLLLDTSCQVNKIWFHEWRSQKDEKLEPQQIDRLARLVKEWTYRSRNDIPRKFYDWIRKPESNFWGWDNQTQGTFYNRLLEDIQELEDAAEKNSIRRRVILVIFYDLVQRERQTLLSEAKKRDRPEKTRSQNTFFKKAIDNILDQTYGNQELSKEVRSRKRKRYVDLHRYGRRWSLFERRETIIDYPIINASNR
ncbi:hypothetical protein BO82DRAFT_94239 [Aspergillus uvarum CBS 121591]|uniref:Uncharacterized protein n=1 Tax=Aspergillus uvarum CBS 121591 TaxID=1448315 RepID=A0A319C7M0_9EURO|nr:hypothetical protein BO82DRAFT_94239 [Aspergillus uvarum CBS 121591]PYH81375.1 hypothetical protein BO82DRAFT_94239 [Aspergillus uvarum CBS 121591]